MLLQVFGAKVEVVPDALCPLPGSEDGTIGLAKTHAKASADRYVMPNQYANQQNVEAHVRTTGPEIWRQTAGKVTHVFTSLGTCGTVMGLSKFLKAKNPAVKIVAVQPSPGHDVPGHPQRLRARRLAALRPEAGGRDPGDRLRARLHRGRRARPPRGPARRPQLRAHLRGRPRAPPVKSPRRLRGDDLLRRRLQVRIQHAQARARPEGRAVRSLPPMTGRPPTRPAPGPGPRSVVAATAGAEPTRLTKRRRSTVMADYAHPEVLVTTDWLKQNLKTPNVRIVEVDVDPEALRRGPHPRCGRLGLDHPAQRSAEARHHLQGGLREAELGGRHQELGHRHHLR